MAMLQCSWDQGWGINSCAGSCGSTREQWWCLKYSLNWAPSWQGLLFPAPFQLLGGDPGSSREALRAACLSQGLLAPQPLLAMVTRVGAASGSWIWWDTGTGCSQLHHVSPSPPCPAWPFPAWHMASAPAGLAAWGGLCCWQCGWTWLCSTSFLGISGYSSLRLQLSYLPFGITGVCHVSRILQGDFMDDAPRFLWPAVGDALKCQGSHLCCCLYKHPCSQSSFSAWPGNKD